MLIQLSQSDMLPVSVEEMKVQLGINGSAYDEQLELWIKSAKERIEGETAKRIGLETWEYNCEDFPLYYEPLYLPLTPVRTVTSVKYWNGTEHVEFENFSMFIPFGRNAFIWSTCWPWIGGYCRPDGVKIQFTVGYDEEGSTSVGSLPLSDKIKQAARAMVALEYTYRDLQPDKSAVETEFGIERILAQIRTIDA